MPGEFWPSDHNSLVYEIAMGLDQAQRDRVAREH